MKLGVLVWVIAVDLLRIRSLLDIVEESARMSIEIDREKRGYGMVRDLGRLTRLILFEFFNQLIVYVKQVLIQFTK